MINPGLIVNAVADAIAKVPELTTLQGAEGRIVAWHPTFPAVTNFARALQAANPGDILIRWLGTGRGSFGENQIWKHQIGVYVRPFNTATEDEASRRYDLARLVIDGQAADGMKILNRQILPGLDLMDVPTLQLQVDSEGLDYFLITFGIPEIGDN